jgi:hypothetical protein
VIKHLLRRQHIRLIVRQLMAVMVERLHHLA